MMNRSFFSFAPLMGLSAVSLVLAGCSGGNAAGLLPTPRAVAPSPTIPVAASLFTAPSLPVAPAPASLAASSQTALPDDLSLAAEKAVNDYRQSQGLAPLTHDDRLARIAGGYAARMAAEGFFSHADPQNHTVFDRLNDAGERWALAGENLAWVSARSGEEVSYAVNGWIASEKHRENMLTPGYTRSAIGVRADASGSVYFVQVFELPVTRP